MGPLALFDKSFLQMLNADEAALFDCLFSAVISPLFFAEVLADLSKETKGGKSAEAAVADLARKTPVLHSTPHPTHSFLASSELRGMAIKMEGIPYRAGGRAKRNSKGEVSIIYDDAPEAEAFARWQDGEFDSIERDFASGWRAQLRSSDHAATAKLLKNVLAISDEPKNLEQALLIAKEVIKGKNQKFLTLKVAHTLLGIDPRTFSSIFKRWVEAGRPSLPIFAPYTSYCLLVDIFFHICIDKKLISPDRASNRIDIAYLYYLPFCQLFISNDKLHRRVAALFIRTDQQYVEGAALKSDLTKLDAFFSSLPIEQRREGLFRLASEPPDDDQFLTTRLWNEVFARNGKRPRERKGQTGKKNKSAASLLKSIKELQETATDPIQMGDHENTKIMALQRKIPRKMGKWEMFPPDFKG